MRRKIGSKTEAQVSVEKMVADSNSPNLVLPLETVVASPSKNSTNEDHKGQDYSKSTVPEIKFTKERIVPSSQLGSPHGLAPQDMGGTVSALTSILEKQTLEPDDNEEADREARYRSRTRSCHADVPDKAIQAASAYNITLANRDHQKQNSMGARDSSSFYIGSTPATNTYDPTSLGTFQMSDKFRCTIHLAQILPVITRVSNHRGRIYSRDTEDEKGRIPPLAFPPPHPLYPGYTRVLELQPSKSRLRSLRNGEGEKVGKERMRGILGEIGGTNRYVGIGGTSPRERATSTNNPSTMVGLATSSFVQLQVSRERTAEEIIWKAIRS
ncbi:hypothetical protein AAMO2058_000931100 [Amorphochlora amoebiformis]